MREVGREDLVMIQRRTGSEMKEAERVVAAGRRHAVGVS